MQTTETVARAITSAVADKRPFSFVRLGDGEGALLGFSPAAGLEDYAYLVRHFGPRTTAEDVGRIRQRLLSAMESADLLGIRDDVWNALPDAGTLDPGDPQFLARFREVIPLRKAEEPLISKHDAQRIHALWRYVLSANIRANICSQWVYADLQLLGFWDELISTQSGIGLINNSERLADRLRKRFSIAVDFIKVPKRAAEATGDTLVLEQHYTVSDSVAKSIPESLNGKVFIVGAGLIGKHYCEIIRSKGGVALDVGALTDAWDGMATRPLVYMSKAPLTASSFGPPPEFRLRSARAAGKVCATPKRLVLHVGLSETDSTSIQSALHENKTLLARYRIRYVHSGRSNGEDINHHPLARAFGAGERPYDQPSPPPQPQVVGRILADVTDEIASTDADVYILSSELFTNFAINQDIEDTFVNWLENSITSVIVHVRNQFDWLCSWYTQAAKQGNMGLFLDEFLDNPHQLPNSERFDGNFLRKVKFLENHVGRENVIVRSFDSDARSSGLVKGFFEAIGWRSLHTPIVAYAKNVSPTDEIVTEHVLRRRLGLPSDFPDKVATPALIDRVLLRGPHSPRRDDLRITVMNRYSDINREIDSRYGIAVSDHGSRPA